MSIYLIDWSSALGHTSNKLKAAGKMPGWPMGTRANSHLLPTVGGLAGSQIQETETQPCEDTWQHHTQGKECQHLLCFRTSGPHTPAQSWAGFISVLPVRRMRLCTFQIKTFKTRTIFVTLSVWLCGCFKTNKNRIKHNPEIILSFDIRSRGWILGYTLKSAEKLGGKKNTQQQNSLDPAREIPPSVD